jgi:4'-phosphopantetheinyl transferase
LCQNLEWEDAADVAALASGDIHVWLFSLSTDEAIRSLLHSYLGAEEKARAARFHFDRDRNHYVVAQGIIRVLLARYIGLEPAALRFCRGASNKPALVDQLNENALTFNLSHTASVAVCAMGRHRNLGIDVEKIREEFGGEDVANRYFSRREVQALMHLPPQQRAIAFFAGWTRKEAYVKAIGAGLYAPLDSFTVSLIPDAPARFLGGVDPIWHLISFSAGRGFPAALVYDGGQANLRLFRLAPDFIQNPLKVLPRADHSERKEVQLREGDRAWGGSME